eukprot:449011-Prorocentrum_minimum.AAC.2
MPRNRPVSGNVRRVASCTCWRHTPHTQGWLRCESCTRWRHTPHTHERDTPPAMCSTQSAATLRAHLSALAEPLAHVLLLVAERQPSHVHAFGIDLAQRSPGLALGPRLGGLCRARVLSLGGFGRSGRRRGLGSCEGVGVGGVEAGHRHERGRLRCTCDRVALLVGFRVSPRGRSVRVWCVLRFAGC